MYKTLSLLHNNEILRLQMNLEKSKRQLALQLAENPNSEEANKLLVSCAGDSARYTEYILPLETINGIRLRYIDQFSICLCIFNAYWIAWYNSDKSMSSEEDIDWGVRSLTFVHFCDAAFRLFGLMKQPSLTTRHRQVSCATSLE